MNWNWLCGPRPKADEPKSITEKEPVPEDHTKDCARRYSLIWACTCAEKEPVCSECGNGGLLERHMRDGVIKTLPCPACKENP